MTDSCSVVSVGIDTSQANNNAEALFGEAMGETFLTVDSLIKSITVWRVPPMAFTPIPTKLWITTVDAAGTPLIDGVVLSGPTISVTGPDRLHPTKIQYAFDPPLVLPRGRKFFFALQGPCDFYFDLLMVDADLYPQGEAWRTGRGIGSTCMLRPNPQRLISNDFIFTIEFCRNAATPVRPTSWGRLKVIYR